MSKLGLQLREHRERQGLSQRDLHKRTGIEQATISRIERGEMDLVSPHLSAIAQQLGIEVFNPLGSNVEPITLQGSLISVWPQSEIPRIMSLQDAGRENEARNHLMSARKHSPHSFAMVVGDESMLPRFRKGDIAIVDPEVPVEVGRFVVALAGKETCILAQYASRGNRVFELIPLNPLYASRRSDTEPLTIIGVVVEKTETDI